MASSPRSRIGCTLGLMLGSLAFQVMAEPPAAPVSKDTGLMTFPNTRVVNAPIAAKATAPAASKSAPAMRAYLDPVTGQLTQQPSAAEAEKLSAASTPARARTLSTARTATAAAAAPEVTYGPGGMASVTLDDESMVFQVARKDANGKLTQECVTGETRAKHALHSSASASHQHTHEASRNDR